MPDKCRGGVFRVRYHPIWKTQPLSHDFPVDSTTWAFLERIDEDLAARIKTCRCCGGNLHAASYPRKPRGVERPLVAEARRLSFCCTREGCRRRVTPPSVRYFGRRGGLRLRVLDSHVAGSSKSRVPSGCRTSGHRQTHTSALAALVARGLRRDPPVAQVAHPFPKTADDAAVIAGRDVLRSGGSPATTVTIDEQVRRRVVRVRRTCRLFKLKRGI